MLSITIGLVQRRPDRAAGEHRDAVGQPAGLGGGVVQPQQVAEDVLVVAVLHLAQVGQHAGGQRLDPARGARARGQGGGAPARAAGHRVGEHLEHAPMGALGERRGGADRRADRDAGVEPLDEFGDGLVDQPGGVRLGLGEPDEQALRLLRHPAEFHAGRLGGRPRLFRAPFGVGGVRLRLRGTGEQFAVAGFGRPQFAARPLAAPGQDSGPADGRGQQQPVRRRDRQHPAAGARRGDQAESEAGRRAAGDHRESRDRGSGCRTVAGRPADRGRV